MANYVDKYVNLPKKKGQVAFVPTIHNNAAFVQIIGDGKGLRYLADLLNYMADLEIEERNMPEGARAHIQLHPGLQLVKHSCEAEICRAEAKGTGELPDCFDD
jgi:hypothetical protein